MIGKNIKRLSRRELVDIIYQLKKNEQEMQEEIDSLKKELEDKRIQISTAGSIADAAISVTNVFSVAQNAADVYLHEISCMKEETEKVCARKIEEAEKKANQILRDGERNFVALSESYQKKYEKWEQLQSEIQTLEQIQKQKLCEDTENG